MYGKHAAMAMISTLVVGGGIGGLSLARELAIRGLPVTVLEKAAQLNPIGAGIIINPNAMRVLERNGLAEALRRDAWPYLMRETCDHRGRLLAVRDYRPLYDSGKLSTGALAEMLNSVADFYDEENETSLERFSNLVQPVLLIVMGAILAGLIMSLYMPLFNLSSVMG